MSKINNVELLFAVDVNSSDKDNWVSICKYLEKNINQSSGIFNLPLKINTVVYDKEKLLGRPHKYGDEIIIDRILYEQYKSDLFILDGLYTKQDQLDFFSTKPSLFFLEIDPSFEDKLKIPKNCISIGKILMTNPELFAWASTKISNKNVYLFYHPEISGKLLGTYEEQLKNNSFKGKLNFIPVPFELSKNFHNAKEENKENIFKKLIETNKNEFKNNSIYFLNIAHDLLSKRIEKLVKKSVNDSLFFSLSGSIENMDCLYPEHGFKLGLNNLNKLINEFPKKDISEIEHLNSGLSHIDSVIGPINYSSNKYYPYFSPSSKEELIKKMLESLDHLDGNKDIYLGCYPIFFTKNARSPKNTTILQNNCSVFGKFREKITSISSETNLFYKQPSYTGLDKEIWYVDIDIIRVNDINVSNESWSAELEIEINSTVKDPLKFIFVKNLLKKDGLVDAKLVRSTKIDSRWQVKYRIIEDFRFSPDITDFPFDKQILKIEYKLEETLINNVMIQPPDSKTADQKFQINGWKIISVKAGINYYKNFDKIGTDRKTFVRVSEFSEVSWNIRRRNIIPAVRSLVPLSVLIFLSWYCSFLPIESASTTIALNTTVFLAGVALYFSADRPSGFSLTLIDKYFVGFYLAHGTILLSELTIFIGKQTYDFTHILWQIMIPIIFLLSIIIFAYKAKNNISNI